LATKPSKNGRPDNFATAVTEVSERMSVLVREEIELAKAEVSQKANSLIRGTVAIAAGAVFGVFAIIFGLLAAAWAINDAFGHLWPGFVIVFVALLAMTAGAFVFARRKLGVGAPTPDMAIDEAKKIRETVATKANGTAESAQAALATAEQANGKAETAQAEKAGGETGSAKDQAEAEAEKAKAKAEAEEAKAKAEAQN